MPPQRPNAPDHLDDFDVCFRLQRPVRRGEHRTGRVVWAPGRWQNLVLIAFGSIFPGLLVGFVARRDEILAEAPLVGLVLAAPLLLLLVAVSLLVLAAGLFHWPRLVLDRRGGVMRVRRRFARQDDASIRFDEIERLEVDHLHSRGDLEPEGAPPKVLYAVLRDGRRAQIAVFPPDELIEEIRELAWKAKRAAPSDRRSRSACMRRGEPFSP